jgi:hypothetical protein
MDPNHNLEGFLAVSELIRLSQGSARMAIAIIPVSNGELPEDEVAFIYMPVHLWATEIDMTLLLKNGLALSLAELLRPLIVDGRYILQDIGISEPMRLLLEAISSFERDTSRQYLTLTFYRFGRDNHVDVWLNNARYRRPMIDLAEGIKSVVQMLEKVHAQETQ